MEDKLKNLTIGKAVIISIVLTAIYYFAFYDDGVALQTQVASVNGEMEKNKAEMQSVRQAILDAARFEQTKATLGEEMDRVLRAIPAQLTTTELMRIISNEAKEVGAEINAISAPQVPNSKKPEGDVFYEPIDVEVDISGSYNQIMLFLSNLTRLDKIITVRKLTILSRGMMGTSGSPSINLKAALSAHKSISSVASNTTAAPGKAAGSE